MTTSNILITGGSGFLGRALTQSLQREGKRVTWVSRQHDLQPEGVDVISYEQLQMTNKSFAVIINLAGAGIADRHWSKARKSVLYDSRLKPTQAILDYMARVKNKPQLFVSSSAIGWYSSRSAELLTETSAYHSEGSEGKSDEFTHQLCDAWEKRARQAEQYGVPTVIIRTGLIFSPQGGMIRRLRLPFFFGLGGKLGKGEQMISWISREDWVRAVLFIMQQHARGQRQHELYNLTSPTPISNAQFTQALGKWLKRPTIFTIPAFLLKVSLGEMSALLLGGQRVLPQHLLDEGFVFSHSEMKTYLESRRKNWAEWPAPAGLVTRMLRA